MTICGYVLTVLEILFLICIILGPILYLTLPPFKYYVKITFFYFVIFLNSTADFFLVLPWPYNVQNYRTVRWLFMNTTKCFHIKHELTGEQYLVSDQPMVIVCNHQSSLDLIGMLWMWPDRCVALMKQSLKYMGLFGLAASFSGSIFIDRFRKDRALEVMGAALKIVQDKNLKLWVFPEGTRNHGPGMLSFKKGAFYLAVQGQIPIVPVVFSSYNFFYSKNDTRFLSDKFSEGFVKIEVLPPISTKGLTTEDVTKLSETTREKMLNVFDRISPLAKETFENRCLKKEN